MSPPNYDGPTVATLSRYLRISVEGRVPWLLSLLHDLQSVADFAVRYQFGRVDTLVATCVLRLVLHTASGADVVSKSASTGVACYAKHVMTVLSLDVGQENALLGGFTLYTRSGDICHTTVDSCENTQSQVYAPSVMKTKQRPSLFSSDRSQWLHHSHHVLWLTMSPQKSTDDLERMLSSNFELSNALNDKIMAHHSGEDPDCDLTCLLEIQ